MSEFNPVYPIACSTNDFANFFAVEPGHLTNNACFPFVKKTFKLNSKNWKVKKNIVW